MNTSHLKKIGKNIRNARKDIGLSQEKLAEAISKSRNYVGMIERGEINIPTLTLIEIAKVLKIETKVLFEY